jgi:hypothetical protein
MLINNNKGLETGEIMLIRLDSGDELLARIKLMTQDEIILEKPLKVVILNGNVGMMDYSVTSDTEKGYIIMMKHIIGYAYPSTSAQQHYMQHATGIQLATP